MAEEAWLSFVGRFGILLLLMALLFLVAWFIRRYMGTARGGREKWIRILAVHHISHKEKFMLVEIPGKVVLVGVTPSRISPITTLDPLDFQAGDQDSNQYGNMDSNVFSQILGTAIGESKFGDCHWRK